jgi:negative regulator of sigma E activity
MNTASADERLSAYLDGELTDAEAAALEQELDRSASLRAQLDALTMVVRTLGDDGPVRAPLGLHAAVMDRIEEEHPQASWWQSFVRRPFGIPQQGWGVMLAAAAVLLVVQLGRSDVDDPVVVDREPVWRDVGDAPAAANLKSVPDDAPPTPEVAAQSRKAEEHRAAEAARERSREPTPVADVASPDVDAAAGGEGALATDAGTADDPEAALLRAPPSGFTFYTSDPSSLRDVLALVGKHGGSITAPDGSAITTAVLEHSEQSVVLRIPSNRLAAFQRDLSALGNVKASFDADKLYGGAEISVPLTFRLSGGGAGDDVKQAAPANRAVEKSE